MSGVAADSGQPNMLHGDRVRTEKETSSDFIAPTNSPCGAFRPPGLDHAPCVIKGWWPKSVAGLFVGAIKSLEVS
ncbi:hypothetical protein NDU88_007012 [Pleurodeles waltl]|uniref:Uncharacterized protein n=1 Tax=Pleurodeles waltl TaxID=8319 RepID=A0AAV7MGP1_PLEWA|nr:hypothetical protein NDU88_007012 [Pleurodeles waltl]